MSSIVLLVLSEGFDDMSLLSCQVILEENNNDVIIASKINGAIKGKNSSVMTVSLDEALKQDINYIGIIIIGGNFIENWSLLDRKIIKMNNNNLSIGAIAEGTLVLSRLFSSKNISESSKIIVDQNIMSLLVPDDVESFAEKYASKLNI